MNIFKNKAKSFLDGYYYPCLILLATLISHALSIELLGIITYTVTVGIGFIVCDDLKFLISPLFMFTLMFSEKSVSAGVFYTTPYLVAIVIFAVFLATMIVIHFILNRKQIDFKCILKSKLFLGFAILCGAFLLNGFFNFDEYVFGNFTFALFMIISLALIFFLFYVGLKFNEETKKYFMYVLLTVSILVTLELFLLFTNQIRFVNGEIVKESVMAGWGMWNNIGGMLAFLVPVHFYFAATVKKYGFLFYGTGLVSYLAIVLTLSRSSLLVSTGIIGLCAIICCFWGENKKINRIITCGIAIIGILGIILLWDKISNILGDYLARGLDDNGRFDIYRRGIKNFLNNPIFGGGFHSVVAQEYEFVSFMPDKYHNTIIQMMGTCGIVGLLAYLFHRYQTIKVFLSNKSLYSVFCALCISAFLLTSLLDNHFFNIYPAFIYATILVIIEKDGAKK